MAWLRSCQELEGHPKLFKLVALSGWEKDAAIGRLHRFWWWVQKYAETGSLEPFNWQEIDAALGFTPGTNFIKMLIKSGFVDSAPMLRVHDWWDHNGPWLMTRYKHYPERWESVKQCYKSENRMNRSKNRSLNRSKNVQRTVDVTDVTKLRPLTPPSGVLATPKSPDPNSALIPNASTPRELGTNPRALGINPRARHENLRALRANPRTIHQEARDACMRRDLENRHRHEQSFEYDMTVDEMEQIKRRNAPQLCRT